MTRSGGRGPFDALRRLGVSATEVEPGAYDVARKLGVSAGRGMQEDDAMTLTEFLLARIAEDEAVAREATAGPWRYDPTKVNSITRDESVFAGERGLSATTVASTGPEDDRQSMADADHIARHNPARVLAECEAKRRIVKMGPSHCPSVDPDDDDEPSPPHYPDARWRDVPHWEACPTCADAAGADAVWKAVLRVLALPYADHEDYNPEWRP